MTIYETLSLMIQAGILLMSLLTFIYIITKNEKK